MSPDPFQAPGLTADWLNGWLAAVGITVLLGEARLGWTDAPSPSAQIWFDGSLCEAIASVLPSVGELDNLCIARDLPGAQHSMGRNVTHEVFRERARIARARFDCSLEVTLTDLAVDKNLILAHGPLDPPRPKGATLHDRLRTLPTELGGDVTAAVRSSLAGRGVRVERDGLGFDHRRFPAGANAKTQPSVDPVVELLAFAGMSLLPVRGSGFGTSARQRGWGEPPTHRGAFTWPAWTTPLGRWAIDALLDRFWALATCRQAGGPQGGRQRQRDRNLAKRLSVSAAFSSLYRQPKGLNDNGRGYASERSW